MATTPPGTKECPHCGTWVQSGFTHCSKCGQKMKADNSGKGRLILLVLILLVAAWICNSVLSGGGSSPSTFSPPSDSDLPRNALVVYEVTGTARTVDLTIENETGNTEQLDDVRLPYKKTFSISRGEFVYLSAQNQGETGSVTCTITVDGDTLETATSSGAYVIAGCSGSAD